MSSLGLARGSRAIIPYFGGMSKVSKSGIHAAWMLAFASMTGEGYPRLRKDDGR